jgi:hypothetical protein
MTISILSSPYHALRWPVLEVDLRGWRRVAQGQGVMLMAPEGPRAGLIKVEPHLPLRPLGAVTAEVLAYARAAFPGAEPVVHGPAITPTAEGEYAATMNVVAMAGGRPAAQHTAGFVFGDTSVAGLEGRCSLPERFDAMRHLVERLIFAHAMGLGTDRWRLYPYVPPTGWAGLRLARATAWLHPRFPRTAATITVFDAQPARPSLAAVHHNRLFAQLGAEYASVAPSGRGPIEVRGMRGSLTRHGARNQDGEVVAAALEARLGDGRFVYGLRLECAASIEAEVRPTFGALLESVQALPPVRDGLEELVVWDG